MATLTRRKTAATRKVSTPDIEKGRATLNDNEKSGSGALEKVNIFLFITAMFLSFSILSSEGFLTPHKIATNPLFHKYVKTFYGEDKYINLLDRTAITLADGGKDTITEVKAETLETPASDTTLKVKPNVEPEVKPKPSPTKIDTNIVKDTEDASLFCTDCLFDAATMGETTCSNRALYFMEKYGLSEEKSKMAVIKAAPTSCVKAPSFCPDCIFDAFNMGKTTCVLRVQYFMEKYGLSEEKSKMAVMKAAPISCVMKA